jgi:hypothetical protein
MHQGMLRSSRYKQLMPMTFTTNMRRPIPGNLAEGQEFYGFAGVAPQRRFEADAARVAEDIGG